VNPSSDPSLLDLCGFTSTANDPSFSPLTLFFAPARALSEAMLSRGDDESPVSACTMFWTICCTAAAAAGELTVLRSAPWPAGFVVAARRSTRGEGGERAGQVGQMPRYRDQLGPSARAWPSKKRNANARCAPERPA
jgi:hypothetical protein